MTTSEFNTKAAIVQKNKKLIKELQAINEKLEDEMKLSLLDMGVNELKTNLYTIRFTDTLTERFQQKEFKAENPELYAKYLKKVSGSRFTIYG
jgi:predicted phage-related endonuclease